jgi:DNA-binding NarL/FixJ family response regulator
MTPIRVLLVDDHTLMRAGIRTLLGHLQGVEVVAEAADGPTALDQIATHRPDVTLLDIAMPGLNGLEVAARVAGDYPQTRVIILTMHLDAEYVRKAIQVGAAGYLLKDSGIPELELAIRAVARGETYLSPLVSKQFMADYLRQSSGEATPGMSLTPRQREVLRLIAEGKSTKQMARILGISVKTVESHRTQLMDRLDIHEVASLVRHALRIGLITPEA